MRLYGILRQAAGFVSRTPNRKYDLHASKDFYEVCTSTTVLSKLFSSMLGTKYSKVEVSKISNMIVYAKATSEEGDIDLVGIHASEHFFYQPSFSPRVVKHLMESGKDVKPKNVVFLNIANGTGLFSETYAKNLLQPEDKPDVQGRAEMILIDPAHWSKLQKDTKATDYHWMEFLSDPNDLTLAKALYPELYVDAGLAGEDSITSDSDLAQ